MRKIKADKSTVMSINFNKKVLAEIDKSAEKLGVSRSTMVNSIMKEHLRKPFESFVRVMSRVDGVDALDMTMREVLEKLK